MGEYSSIFARKKSEPCTSTSPTGADAKVPGRTSFTSAVPASVPSEAHSSTPPRAAESSSCAKKTFCPEATSPEKP